ncbi:cyclomaltodextrinase C-terminal domain-containing protein [uncultured Bacteroides sp.]|uniref:cyclomaltodextrinase C-terminal domain-containing protein n=1 Tax=uncultured Bacteroides sp. TaxID=162156 RepID=UPI00260679E9|nr:cyclomaltodextrinase C-terminal domain-containing protein [uncultured Bacteroides sp.]
MLENKTIKYHIPEQGLYLYARMNGDKTEMIVLNSTDKEQVLPAEHYNVLTKENKEGKEIATGKTVSLTENLILSARQSMIIEF